MNKNKQFQSLLLLIISIFFISSNLSSIMKIIEHNYYSKKLLNQKFNFVENFDLGSKVYEGDCHLLWMHTIVEISKNKFLLNNEYQKKIISCSPLHAKMINVFFPKEKKLAQTANMVYPQNREFLLWLLDSVWEDTDYSERVLDQLLELDSNDALVLRRYGSLLWKKGSFKEGLQAYLNACKIDDITSNGCYYVGKSYRSLGDLEKAIYYFRLSYWSPSWEIADQLEAELSAQNP